MTPTERWAYEQQQRDGGADEEVWGEDEPYCAECGSDDMQYIEQYANGCEYKCRACSTTRIWS